MSASLAAEVTDGHGLDADREPVPVAQSISTLLRAMPAPSDPAALVGWLVRKADLFDQIATAAADPGLASDARAVAAAARHTVATLAAGGLTAVSTTQPLVLLHPSRTGGAA